MSIIVLSINYHLFIRLNYTKLLCQNYVYLCKVVVHDGNLNNNKLGKIVPDTTKEIAHEYAQDTMAYVSAYGCPEWFITFMCIPKIKNSK